MIEEKFFDVIYHKFEKFVIVALASAIMIAIAYAAFLFFIILIKTIANIEPIWSTLMANTGAKGMGESITLLQGGLYNIFGGFLLILLGMELINTVRSFSKDNHIKMESIVAIAIIATARHLITLDYHHTDALVVFAVGFVILALIVGYFLLRFPRSN